MAIALNLNLDTLFDTMFPQEIFEEALANVFPPLASFVGATVFFVLVVFSPVYIWPFPLLKRLMISLIQIFAISSSPGDVYPAESPVIWCRFEIGFNLKLVRLVCMMGILYNLYMLYLNSNAWVALSALFYMVTAV